MRIFLDANILFSAARSAGAVRQLLTMLLSRKHRLCVDEYVVTEARRNLSAKASEESLRVLDELLTRMEISPARIGGLDTDPTSWLPEKDRPVLQAAIRLRCDALVTGDITHFGAGFGKTFEGVTIYSPRLIAEALLL
jgi:uncharacterized protein